MSPRLPDDAFRSCPPCRPSAGRRPRARHPRQDRGAGDAGHGHARPRSRADRGRARAWARPRSRKPSPTWWPARTAGAAAARRPGRSPSGASSSPPTCCPTTSPGSTCTTRRRRGFVFAPGPVFASVLLADEINRTTPKVQSALLEVMAEGQVTVGNRTRAVDPFFFVDRHAESRGDRGRLPPPPRPAGPVPPAPARGLPGARGRGEASCATTPRSR